MVLQRVEIRKIFDFCGDFNAEGVTYHRQGRKPLLNNAIIPFEPQRGGIIVLQFLCHPFWVRATAHAVSVGLHPRLRYVILSGLNFAANQMNPN